MQNYDLTLKDLLMDGAPVLLQQMTGGAEVRLMPLEVPVVGGGRLDLFGDLDGNKALHVEIQADNHAAMAVRMLGYLWLALRQRPALQVRQIVLYVGREAMRMPDRLSGPGLHYHFDLIDARRLAAEALLASDHPCDIIMALFATTDDLRARVHQVITRLAARFADSPSRLREALVRVALLAPLRDAVPLVEEEINLMPITIDLETHPFASRFFQKGRAEGHAEGEARGRAAMLLRLVRRRWGNVPPDTEDRIRTADSAQLEIWMDHVLDARTLADVFDPPH